MNNLSRMPASMVPTKKTLNAKRSLQKKAPFKKGTYNKRPLKGKFVPYAFEEMGLEVRAFYPEQIYMQQEGLQGTFHVSFKNWGAEIRGFRLLIYPNGSFVVYTPTARGWDETIQKYRIYPIFQFADPDFDKGFKFFVAKHCKDFLQNHHPEFFTWLKKFKDDKKNI